MARIGVGIVLAYEEAVAYGICNDRVGVDSARYSAVGLGLTVRVTVRWGWG